MTSEVSSCMSVRKILQLATKIARHAKQFVCGVYFKIAFRSCKLCLNLLWEFCYPRCVSPEENAVGGQ